MTLFTDEVPPLWPLRALDDKAVRATRIMSVGVNSISMVLNKAMPQVGLLQVLVRNSTDDGLGKIDTNGILDKRNQDAIERAEQWLEGIREQLSLVGDLPEVDWSRMRSNLDFQEALRKRDMLSRRTLDMQCRTCPSFTDHVGLQLLLYPAMICLVRLPLA
jgi:hypothetical protein